jgi:hypothetical protein
MSIFKKIKKGTTSAAKGAYNGLKQGWSEATMEAECLRAIDKVRRDIQGHDPRTWMKSCAQSTLFHADKGPKYFVDCLENKLRKEIHDLENPREYAESLWHEIKNGCQNCCGGIFLNTDA